MNELLDEIGKAFGGIVGHPVVTMGARLVLVYLAIVWIASTWWTWRDMRSRTHDPISPYLAAGFVVLFTPLLFLLAVLVYRVLRPPLTLVERDADDLQRRLLEEEAVAVRCRRCGAAVDDAWMRCPTCGQTLAVRCRSCGRSLGLDWEICAWCAAEVPWGTTDAEAARPLPGPVAIPIQPGGRPLVPVMAVPASADEDGGGSALDAVEVAARAALDSARRAEASMTVDVEPVPWADGSGGESDARRHSPERS